MMLTIISNYLQDGEAYLKSSKFWDDLLESQIDSKTELPIYFDVQNNAYEVPSGGHTSENKYLIYDT